MLTLRFGLIKNLFPSILEDATLLLPPQENPKDMETEGMDRDPSLTEQLRSLLAQLTSLTVSGSLHWERQLNSSHRYAAWNDNMLILGPAAPLEDHKTSRYLFVTPFSSPTCIEITSDDAELRAALLALVYGVEAATANQEPRDPFSLTKDALSELLR